MNKAALAPIKYGLGCGLIICIYTMLEFYLGVHGKNVHLARYFEPGTTLIQIVLLYVGISELKVITTKEFKLMHGVQFGLMLSLVAGIVIGLFNLLYNSAINPDWAALQAKTEANPENYNMALTVFQSKTYQLFGKLLPLASWGVIFSAIVTWYVMFKSKKQEKANVGNKNN